MTAPPINLAQIIANEVRKLRCVMYGMGAIGLLAGIALILALVLR